MDFLKKLFPLSKSMSDTFKRYLIGCGIYAAIWTAAFCLVNMATAPLTYIAMIPVIGWFTGLPLIVILSFMVTLVEVYCLVGAVLLTVWFWKREAAHDNLKKVFPLAFLLNNTKSQFILSIVLYVVAYVVLKCLLVIVGLPLAFIPLIGKILVPVVQRAVWVYFAVTLTQHILAYREK